MSIPRSLKEARVRAGLSLSEAAERSGLQRSNIAAVENGRRDPTASTIERMAEAARVRFITAENDGRTTAREASTALQSALRDGDVKRAYRILVQLADDLAAPDATGRFLLALEAPVAVSPEWDAAIAGVTEWRLEQALLPLPRWVDEERGDEDWSWTPQISAASVPTRESHVPKPLRRRGVLIEAEELTSA
ncbi:helix-turn-helix domain-containing protein [Herbiconiux solani]|uniref:helix-turn-helix domain-containing protein n=1 Tax=Herbiconiux solani TaxID=661329 RepID=UPI0008249CD6|nr:helix-turn-helix transcriptional regulator [Herbiconiux solani]